MREAFPDDPAWEPDNILAAYHPKLWGCFEYVENSEPLSDRPQVFGIHEDRDNDLRHLLGRQCNRFKAKICGLPRTMRNVVATVKNISRHKQATVLQLACG